MGRYQIVVLRFTPRQLRSEPAAVIEEIRRTLDGARNRPPLDLRTIPAGTQAAAETGTGTKKAEDAGQPLKEPAVVA